MQSILGESNSVTSCRQLAGDIFISQLKNIYIYIYLFIKDGRGLERNWE